MSLLFVIINVAIFLLALAGLWLMAKKHVKFPTRVFTALGLGIVLGLLLHLIYGAPNMPPAANRHSGQIYLYTSLNVLR